MKRILLLALLALSSTAAAKTQGTLKITIIRTEIVWANNDYQWVTKVLCEETLPITVADTRHDGTHVPFGHSDSCKFVEGGNNYTAHTFYLAMISKLIFPGGPGRDTLGFSSQITVVDDKHNAPPFVIPAAQAFYTRDLNLKNAIMTLISDQSITCDADGVPVPLTPQSAQQRDCRPNNPLGIQAVFDYELN